MPRKSKETGTPKKFRQRKLDVYMSSSPPASNDELSPALPSKRMKRRRARLVTNLDLPEYALGPPHEVVPEVVGAERLRCAQHRVVEMQERLLCRRCSHGDNKVEENDQVEEDRLGGK